MSVPGKMHSWVESHKSRVSIETLDVARVRNFYRRDLSWITGRGTRGGGDRRPVLDAVPSQCRDPIDRSTHRAVARLKRRKTAGGGGYRGSATGEAQWPIGPWTMGPHVGRPWTIGQRRRWDGHAKWWSAAGSPALWRTCRNTGWEGDR